MLLYDGPKILGRLLFNLTSLNKIVKYDIVIKYGIE